jgi:hypothetical protein
MPKSGRVVHDLSTLPICDYLQSLRVAFDSFDKFVMERTTIKICLQGKMINVFLLLKCQLLAIETSETRRIWKDNK